MNTAMKLGILSEEYQKRLLRVEAVASEIAATLPEGYDPLLENAYSVGFDRVISTIDSDDSIGQYGRLLRVLMEIHPSLKLRLLALDGIVGVRLGLPENDEVSET